MISITKKDKGVILSVISNDVKELKIFIGASLVELWRSCLTLLFVFPVMFQMSALVTSIVLFIVLIMVLINFSQSKKIKRHSSDIKDKRDQLGALSLKYLLNIENIKANCLENDVVKEYEEALESSINSTRKQGVLRNVLANLSRVFSTLLLCAIYGIGFYLIQSGRLTFGEMIAFSMYGGLLYYPLDSLVNIRNTWFSVQPSIHRLEEYLFIEKENYDGEEIDQITNIKLVQASKTFDDKAIKYDLHIESQKRYAIVGQNGCGKTTLFRLLLGLLQADYGSVMVNGLELNHLNMNKLRSNISYMSQSTPLMEGKAKDVLGVTDYNRNQFNNYIDAFDVRAVLNEGEETVINKTLTLSGGEQQSLKIIKVLISDCDLILLDEPSNNLDGIRKKKLLKTSSRLRKNSPYCNT